MWQRLGLSLAECRVYGYIYGLTTSKRTEQKGYKGSKRALAQKLGLDEGGTSRILNDFINRGLVQLKDGIYTSVESVSTSDESVSTSDESVNTSDESVSTSDESVSTSDESVSSPIPPIIKEINKEMERNNNIARETLATQDPKPFDLFNEFLSAYGASHNKGLQQGDLNQMAQNLRECRMLWDAKTPTEQRLLLRAVKDGKWSKPRLDWTISDYQVPEPTNYNGYSFPMGAQMVIAIYNGKGGIYTKADAELYGMTIKKEIEP